MCLDKEFPIGKWILPKKEGLREMPQIECRLFGVARQYNIGAAEERDRLGEGIDVGIFTIGVSTNHLASNTTPQLLVQFLQAIS
jgi:hypothetical protein